MGLTISKWSALNVIRTLRCRDSNIREFAPIGLATPTPKDEHRWSSSQFSEKRWEWGRPTRQNPLHILVAQPSERTQCWSIKPSVLSSTMPGNAVLYIDDFVSTVGPELLFVQMANELALPELVMLGYELCGNFSLAGIDSIEGGTRIGIQPATCVEDIRRFAQSIRHVRGKGTALRALRHVSDGALSVPEAILGAMYSLPDEEGGYGMGPVTLNKRIRVSGSVNDDARHRYPDLLFSFAKIGINYDGSDHLDLDGLIRAVQASERAEGSQVEKTRAALLKKQQSVRDKVVDDNHRNNQLASRGYVVLPATKEDLVSITDLDTFTHLLLGCAQNIFNVDVDRYFKTVNDSSRSYDRENTLLALRNFCQK